MNTKGTLRCMAALGGILFATAPAANQLTVSPVAQEEAADEHIADLIKRLEIGMSALEELGRRDAVEIVQRIANELRQERERTGAEISKDENDEIRTVRRRLKVMRTAVDAFLEANRRDAAELVERAMHARELSIEGRRDEEANRIRAAAPNHAQLAETLGAAARLYGEWNRPERAEALAALAETYAKQWQRRQEASRESRVTERERDSGDGLESLARRVDIMRYARAAFAEAGDERNARVLEGVIHYGELALEGVNDERLAKAAEAVPDRGNLIEYLSWASRKYAEWGNEDRAADCRALAGYYARQLQAEPLGDEEQREAERSRATRGDIEDLNRRIEILGFAHGALERAGHLEWAHSMGRFLRVAELQREGADGEVIAQAFEGLTMGLTIELLQKASGLYAEWGMEGRAAACDQLAEHYAARERGRVSQASAEGGRGSALSDEVRVELRELMRRTNELREELQAIQAQLERLIER